jgi:hypothetical protein
MRHLGQLMASILVLLLMVAGSAAAASHGGGPGGGGHGDGGGGGNGGAQNTGGGAADPGNGSNDPTGVTSGGTLSMVGKAYDVVFTFADGRMQRAKLVFTNTRVTCEVIAAAGAQSLEFTEKKAKSDDAPVAFDATGPGSKGSQLELSGKTKGDGISGDLAVTPKQGDKLHASFIGGLPGSDQAQKALDAFQRWGEKKK